MWRTSPVAQHHVPHLVGVNHIGCKFIILVNFMIVKQNEDMDKIFHITNFTEMN